MTLTITFDAKIVPVGNSKGVIIPASVLKYLNLKLGDELVLSVPNDETITLKKKEAR